MFSYEFCKICKNTFFPEHDRTTASDFSSINSSEGRIVKRNCKLWYKNLCTNLSQKCKVLIIAVSIVVKGELSNKTVNYDTKTCTSLSQKCKVIKKGQSCWILNRFQKQSFADFLQIGALKSFANSTGKHLCWKALLKRNLNAGVFVKFAYFKEHLVLQNSSCGCFWRLTRIAEWKPVLLSTINPRFSWKKYFLLRKSALHWGR